ncbi:hypothetical protein J4439_04995, partial [Candidatus Woesearchaeota archaeon]|nr:hypothetical protein [Candidatus Woesearchaeota archaeon]
YLYYMNYTYYDGTTTARWFNATGGTGGASSQATETSQDAGNATNVPRNYWVWSDTAGIVNNRWCSYADDFYIWNSAVRKMTVYQTMNNLSVGVEESQGTSATEGDGDAAIDAGIAASTASSANGGTNSTEQQAVVVSLDGTQTFNIYDRIAADGSQRWLFLYKTSGENRTNISSIPPALYVWENESLTSAAITAQVSGFINDTNT